MPLYFKPIIALPTLLAFAECMGLYTINHSQNKLFKVKVIGNIYENKELLK